MQWNITGVKPAYYLKLFWSMWCPKISSSRSLHKGPVLAICCQEWRNLWHCSISKIFHVILATLLLKRKFQHVCHKWVICGSHPGCSVGQWVKWVIRCDPLSILMLSLCWCLYIPMFVSKHAAWCCNISNFDIHSYISASYHLWLQHQPVANLLLTALASYNYS